MSNDPNATLRTVIIVALTDAFVRALETDAPPIEVTACATDLIDALLDLDDPPELADALEPLGTRLLRALQMDGPSRWSAVQGVAEEAWPHLRPYLEGSLPERAVVALERTLACRTPEAFTAAAIEFSESAKVVTPAPPRGPGRARSLYVGRMPKRNR